jgi:hypothetical protein
VAAAVLVVLEPERDFLLLLVRHTQLRLVAVALLVQVPRLVETALLDQIRFSLLLLLMVVAEEGNTLQQLLVGTGVVVVVLLVVLEVPVTLLLHHRRKVTMVVVVLTMVVVVVVGQVLPVQMGHLMLPLSRLVMVETEPQHL